MQDAQALVFDTFPSRISALEELLQSSFSESVPSKVFDTFANELTTSLDKAEQVAPCSPTITTLTSVVSDVAALAVDDLCNTRQWITMLVPAISDGNNFGAEVQGFVLEAITKAKDSIAPSVDPSSDYFFKRAGAIEKMLTADGSAETVVVDEKEKKEDKLTESHKETTTKKQSSKKGVIIQDYRQFVARLDCKQYMELRLKIKEILHTYYMLGSLVEKNSEKITAPRGGEGDSGRGPASMY